MTPEEMSEALQAAQDAAGAALAEHGLSVDAVAVHAVTSTRPDSPDLDQAQEAIEAAAGQEGDVLFHLAAWPKLDVLLALEGGARIAETLMGGLLGTAMQLRQVKAPAPKIRKPQPPV